MHFALSHHALHVFERMAKQFGLAVVHQVVPQPAAYRQRFGTGPGFEADPVGVSSGFTWPEPGIGSGRSLRIAAVLAVTHVTPQRFDDRPLG